MNDVWFLQINELTNFRELGIHISIEESAEVREKSKEIATFDKWLKAVAPKYFALAVSRMPDWQKDGLQKLYNQSRSTVTTNTSEGLENQRDNYEVEIIDEWVKTPEDPNGKWVVKDFIVTLKGPDDKNSGNKNPKFEKITPFEKNNKKGLFSFISPKDLKVERTVKDDDGEKIIDSQGNYIKDWNDSNNFWDH